MPTNIHITCAKDLVTLRSARRSGFIEYALRKNKESVPFIDRAKALRAILNEECNTPQDILSVVNVRESLLEAAGISVKAKAHLDDEDKSLFLAEFVEKVLVPSGADFVEEVAFRYLLSAGDALGGKMRNIVGAIASEKVTRFIISQLQVKSMDFSFSFSKYTSFVEGKEYKIDDAQDIKAIQWVLNPGEKRHLVYNTTLPQVRKNIDIVLLSCFFNSNSTVERNTFLADKDRYVCVGELKGGIDPAGADEHWKTANTALGRVRTAFEGTGLHVLFIGAAIEAAMAREIFEQYDGDQLSNCANLTSDDQLSALCNWFTSI